MKKAVRLLLLGVGAVAMIATSARQGQAVFFPLGAGGAEVLSFEYTADEQIEALVTINFPLAQVVDASSGELIGIVRSDVAPTTAALEALDVDHPFVVGEEIEGVGSVAFVLPSPGDVRFGPNASQPAFIRSPGKHYLTLLARHASLQLDVTFDDDQMALDCGCDVSGTLGLTGVRREAPPPTAETDGGSDAGGTDAGQTDAGETDGGVSDGG